MGDESAQVKKKKHAIQEYIDKVAEHMRTNPPQHIIKWCGKCKDVHGFYLEKNYECDK